MANRTTDDRPPTTDDGRAGEYDFEVEIESGGRAYDSGVSARREPVVLSPARAAAKERARNRRMALVGLLVLAVAGFAAWFWFTNPQANIPDDAVARVNGEFIYQADVDKRLDFTRFLNDIAKSPDATLPSAASKLEEIIYERRQLQDARKAGVKVDEQKVDAAIGQMRASTGLSEQEITGKLEKYSLKMEDLRAYVANTVMIKDYEDGYIVAGAKDVQEEQNKENDWLTSLAQTSKIERFKAAGSGAAPRVGSEAPEIVLKDLDGKEVKLSSLKGRPVMVNFWATWCPPCRQEIPVISKMYSETHGDSAQGGGMAASAPYEILGVATQSDGSTVKAFTQEFGMEFPVMQDVESRVTSDYHVLPIPTSFFIDKDGIIRFIQTGMVDKPMMEKWLLGK
jgi:thiol-disulfide isomerase/thioredoxin